MSRVPVGPCNPSKQTRLIKDFGLENDRHARAGSQRQVLLIDEETLQSMNLEIGEVKENLTTRGIALGNLTRGHVLQIGVEVRLQITRPCEPCSRMDEIRPGLRRRLSGRRGMLARVLSGGEISVGDSIRIG